MPVEIKEIVIRAIVREQKYNAAPANHTELLKENAAHVLKIIEKKKER